jgi:ATP-dependent DNA helicase RecQ
VHLIDVLRARTTSAAVAMRRTVERKRAAATRRIGTAAALAPADAGLLAQLKAWRLDQARAQGVPAYVILHDATLAEIARRQPAHLDALAGIGGIGAKKLERYGEALVALVREHG